MNRKTEIFAIIEQIENTQKAKGIAKYGDLDIRSRRSKEQLLIDILEELQDSINYFKALGDAPNDRHIYQIQLIMMDVAQIYVLVQAAKDKYSHLQESANKSEETEDFEKKKAYEKVIANLKETIEICEKHEISGAYYDFVSEYLAEVESDYKYFWDEEYGDR